MLTKTSFNLGLFIFMVSLLGGTIFMANMAKEYDNNSRPSRRLHEESLSCYRPYVVSINLGSASNTYYCHDVSNYSGTECIEKSWFFYTTEDDHIPNAESYKENEYEHILWGSASIVTIRKIDKSSVGTPCSESEKQ